MYKLENVPSIKKDTQRSQNSDKTTTKSEFNDPDDMNIKDKFIDINNKYFNIQAAEIFENNSRKTTKNTLNKDDSTINEIDNVNQDVKTKLKRKYKRKKIKVLDKFQILSEKYNELINIENNKLNMDDYKQQHLNEINSKYIKKTKINKTELPNSYINYFEREYIDKYKNKKVSPRTVGLIKKIIRNREVNINNQILEIMKTNKSFKNNNNFFNNRKCKLIDRSNNNTNAKSDMIESLKQNFRKYDIFASTNQIMKNAILGSKSKSEVTKIIEESEKFRLFVKNIKHAWDKDRINFVSKKSNFNKNDSFTKNGKTFNYEEADFELYGKSTLIHFNSKLIIWYNTQLEISNDNEYVCFVDGKMSSVAFHWKQTFEVLIVNRKNLTLKPVTIVFALLDGTSSNDYFVLFDKLFKYSNINITYFVCDYEMAIHKAIRLVFPNAHIQGCYFHYCRNLRIQSVFLASRYKSKVSLCILALCKVLPFFKYPSLAITQAIEDIKINNDHFYKNTDFKFLIYVFYTYVVRFQNTFLINPFLKIEKTNNVCEGRNSQLQKQIQSRPSIKKLMELIQIRFKNDVYSSENLIQMNNSKNNDFEDCAEYIHLESGENMKQIIKDIYDFGYIKSTNAEEFLENKLFSLNYTDIDKTTEEKISFDYLKTLYWNYQKIKNKNQDEFKNAKNKMMQKLKKRAKNDYKDDKITACSDAEFSFLSENNDLIDNFDMPSEYDSTKLQTNNYLDEIKFMAQAMQQRSNFKSDIDNIKSLKKIKKAFILLKQTFGDYFDQNEFN